jgi:hypothetical protein
MILARLTASPVCRPFIHALHQRRVAPRPPLRAVVLDSALRSRHRSTTCLLPPPSTAPPPRHPHLLHRLRRWPLALCRFLDPVMRPHRLRLPRRRPPRSTVLLHLPQARHSAISCPTGSTIPARSRALLPFMVDTRFPRLPLMLPHYLRPAPAASTLSPQCVAAPAAAAAQAAARARACAATAAVAAVPLAAPAPWLCRSARRRAWPTPWPRTSSHRCADSRP